jgi:hypothetical protein
MKKVFLTAGILLTACLSQASGGGTVGNEQGDSVICESKALGKDGRPSYTLELFIVTPAPGYRVEYRGPNGKVKVWENCQESGITNDGKTYFSYYCDEKQGIVARVSHESDVNSRVDRAFFERDGEHSEMLYCK